MPAKAKIDDQIMLELANKGLSTAEIARYFDVTHAAVRSKAVTLSKKHPDMMQIASRSNDTKNLPLCNRVNIELDRYMLESSNVQKHLAKMPIESTLDHLDQRNTVILKGLQILEKIQKIGNPQGSDAPKTIQVNQITNYIGNKSMTSNPGDKSQVIDAEHVTD